MSPSFCSAPGGRAGSRGRQSMDSTSSPPRRPTRAPTRLTHIAPIVMRLVRTATRTAIPRDPAIRVRLEGEDLVESAYWDSVLAARGVLYLVLHDGGVALLVPPSLEYAVPEMRTGREVIVTRGPWPEQGQKDALELLWEDGTGAPFAVHLSAPQCSGLAALRQDLSVPGCRVYTRGRDGRPQLAGTWRARVRRAERLPYLRPWSVTPARSSSSSELPREEQGE